MSLFGDDTVRLVREGKEPVDVLIQQVTPQRVARVFSLDPASVWLQEEFGNRAYFPNTTGASFDLPSDIGLTAPSLVVQGQANQASSVAHIPTIATPGPSTCGPSSRPPFTARKSMPSVSVKVVQATMSRQASGKPSFNKLGQTYLDLTDATANVSYVKHMIRQRWGAEYTLVTLDGLELEDSSGTQGFKFWKIGSRKLFAVKEEDIVKKKGKGKGRKMPVLSDYEDDDYDDSSAFSPAAAKKQKNDCGSVELESIMEDVKSIHRDLQSVLKLTPNSKVPLGLKQVLLDTFRCNICIATPMVPPIIYTRCCKRILGCQSCVDTWYSGEEGMRKKCPICRSERAYADTTQLKGLDDFLLTITPILNQGGTNTEDEPEVDMAE